MTARVLVVDDILSNVKLLEAKLSAEYFEVASAFNGADALARMDEHIPDIVLLDVMMPGMDGFEVCRRLKAGLTTHHLPVVMVTALDQPSDRLKGLEAGADDFLTKPVSDVALIARVRSLARLIVNRSDQHRARRRLLSNLFGRVTGGEGAGEQAGNQDDSALHGVRLPRLVGRGRGG